MATQMLAYDVGGGVGGLLWGSIIDISGFNMAFAGAGIAFIISIIVSLIMIRQK